MWACDACIRRTWLLQLISSYLEFQRDRLSDVLSLEDRRLIELAEARLHMGLPQAYAEFAPRHAEAERARAKASRLEFLCICEPEYPSTLQDLRAPPTVLYVAGGMQRFLELAGADPVSIVGARRATQYGTDVANMLGRGVSASGLTVVSGLAIGVDAAAHRGSMEAGGRSIAVMPGCAAEVAPKANAALYAKVLRKGVAISELGPGAATRRWTYVARNRVVAALSRITIVVQAREKSGTKETIDIARELGRTLGGVPGSVLSRLSDRPNTLLADGAAVIRGPQDVLDAVFGTGTRQAQDRSRDALEPTQLAVLEAIAGGADTLAALGRTEALVVSSHGAPGEQLLVTLAGLELTGFVRRTPGGRYAVIA